MVEIGYCLKRVAFSSSRAHKCAYFHRRAHMAGFECACVPIARRMARPSWSFARRWEILGTALTQLRLLGCAPLLTLAAVCARRRHDTIKPHRISTQQSLPIVCLFVFFTFDILWTVRGLRHSAVLRFRRFSEAESWTRCTCETRLICSFNVFNNNI